MNDVIKQLQQNRYRMSQLMCQLMRIQQQRIETALILEDVDETSSDDQDNWGGRQVGSKNYPIMIVELLNAPKTKLKNFLRCGYLNIF